MTTAVLRNGYSWHTPRRSAYETATIIARRIRALLRLRLRLLKLKVKQLQAMRETDLEHMDNHMRRDIGLDPLPTRPVLPEIGWL